MKNIDWKSDTSWGKAQRKSKMILCIYLRIFYFSWIFVNIYVDAYGRKGKHPTIESQTYFDKYWKFYTG